MLKKIIFMGTPEFSVPSLEIISNSKHKILCVYTQPPKKKYRGQNIIDSPVSQFAIKNNLKVRTPQQLDNEKDYEFFIKNKPDLVVVVAYGQIISKRFLDIPNIQFINLHASLLPKWRGAAPIERSIMNLDKKTGISIMKIVPELDAGPCMKQIPIKIDDTTTAGNLKKELSRIGAKSLIESINVIEEGKAKFINQEHELATYAKKISKSETRIEWNYSAKKIIAKINALNPFPGAWFKHNNNRLKILKAVEIDKSGKAGQLINDDLIIACSENAIQILKIQKEGKKVLDKDQFLVGNKIKKGTQLI
jgi:methionyl-tRNA formyltransferase